MFTTGAKFFYAVAIVAFLAALGLGWTTGGNGLGPLTGGYKGSVGDHLGYTILLFTAATSLFFGLTTSAFRDADPDAAAEVAGTDVVPAVAPATVSYWPAVAAFALGIVVLGLVLSNVVFVAGLIVLGFVILEWLVQAWSERATGDPATNKAIRNRLMYPLEIPIGGVLAIGLVVFSLSRVLLAVSKAGAVVAAGVLAVIVLAVGTLIAQKPRISSNVVAGLLFVGAIGVLTAGVAGVTAGERDFEHEEEHSEETEEPAGEEEGGLAPIGAGD
jgi:hypothetical protein